jgi:hypothetical protein
MLNNRIRVLVLTIAAVGFLAVPVGRSAAQTPLNFHYYCQSAGNLRLWCTASPSGGGPPYTYNWTPNPESGWTEAAETIVPCQFPHYHTVYNVYGAYVTLAVTDSYGTMVSRRTFFECGEAQ